MVEERSGDGDGEEGRVRVRKAVVGMRGCRAGLRVLLVGFAMVEACK